MESVKINEKQLYSIISESIIKILREERSENIDNDIIELISYLHNIQKPLREIHWNTNEYSTHMVTDETIGDVIEWEDTLAEAFVSNTNIELTIGDVKPSSDYKTLMEELINKASTIKDNISDNKEYDSICAVLDEIIEKSNQLLYKSQLK